MPTSVRVTLINHLAILLDNMLKTYQFRMYPTKMQKALLDFNLESARFVYNEQLASKIKAYEEDGRNLTNFESNNSLISLKENHPGLKQVHSQVLQNINQRITYAFENFFRRVKNYDEEPGYPRFKGRNRYNSITYPQSNVLIF